jgi:3,4-dihydroxy 2-butanone 4-phosphate synthase / GTP cyclohydrolase II
MAISSSTVVRLQYGQFRVAYHSSIAGDCVSVSYGEPEHGIPIIRLHSSCLFGEAFHAVDCDCSEQLDTALKLIKKNRSGVVVYRYAEGRGIGLESKIKAIELQRKHHLNTVEAFRALGFDPDPRTYDAEIAALKDLHVSSTIKVASKNPRKLAALQAANFKITGSIQVTMHIAKHNIHELITKRDILGHDLNLEGYSGV